MTGVHRPGDGKAGTASGENGGRQRRGGKGIYTGAIPAARAFLEDIVVLQTPSSSAFLPGDSASLLLLCMTL